jgi:serine/threonine protein kinase
MRRGCPTEPAAGTCLGVFQLTRLIGRGDMGEVYRARDTRLDRSVAIRILPEAFAHDSSRLVCAKGHSDASEESPSLQKEVHDANETGRKV